MIHPFNSEIEIVKSYLHLHLHVDKNMHVCPKYLQLKKILLLKFSC